MSFNGATTTGNVVAGNLIGTNAAGTAPLPNRSGVGIGSQPFDSGGERLAALLDRPVTRNAITAVILFNAVILGLETSDAVMAAAGPLIVTLDWLCLAVFVLEIVAKIVARGPAFFRSGWNVLKHSRRAPSRVSWPGNAWARRFASPQAV